MNYPLTKTVDASDTYFGKTYRDPYRWLENVKDGDAEAWFRAQADLTDSVLAKIPGRDALVEEWMALDQLKPAEYSAITYENGRVFYKKTLGGENVGRLFLRESWDGPERLLFDPAGYKAGVTTTIQGFVPSWNGKHVAIALSSCGTEYSEVRVLEVERATLLPDRIYPSLGPFGWTRDGSAFFYDAGKVTDITATDIELNRKARLHKLGTEASTDVDFFSNESYPGLEIPANELVSVYIDESYPDYVIGFTTTAQNEMRIFYAPSSEIGKQSINWNVLCERSDMLVRGLAFDRDHVYAVTHAGTPNYKVVRTSVRHPDWKHAEMVVPEAADSIQYITKSKHYLLVVYSNGVAGRLLKYNLSSGTSETVNLPASGIVNVTCPDRNSDRCLVFIESWTSPQTIYDLMRGRESSARAFSTRTSHIRASRIFRRKK